MSATAPVRADGPLDRANLGSILFLLCLAGFVCAAAFFDLALVTAYVLLPGVCVLLAILSAPAVACVAAYRRRWMLVSYVLSLAVVLTALALPWHARKRFVWDLRSVKAGMAVDDVEAIMGLYIKGAGAKWGEAFPADYPPGAARAHCTGTMTYRWNTAENDSDWGQVTFANGRVVETEFLPD